MARYLCSAYTHDGDWIYIFLLKVAPSAKGIYSRFADQLYFSSKKLR